MPNARLPSLQHVTHNKHLAIAPLGPLVVILVVSPDACTLEIDEADLVGPEQDVTPRDIFVKNANAM